MKGLEKSSKYRGQEDLLTLFLLGRVGVNMTPPPRTFFHNSKSIGLRLMKLSDFS